MWFSVLPICYYLPYLEKLFVHLGGPAAPVRYRGAGRLIQRFGPGN